MYKDFSKRPALNLAFIYNVRANFGHILLKIVYIWTNRTPTTVFQFQDIFHSVNKMWSCNPYIRIVSFINYNLCVLLIYLYGIITNQHPIPPYLIMKFSIQMTNELSNILLAVQCYKSRQIN